MRRSRTSKPARSARTSRTSSDCQGVNAMAKRVFKVWRGDIGGGDLTQFDIDVDPGMVVLDVLHRIQAQQANDLALRWNCKAGKCGSCSMEINGKPKLACMTRMNSFADDATI